MTILAERQPSDPLSHLLPHTAVSQVEQRLASFCGPQAHGKSVVSPPARILAVCPCDRWKKGPCKPPEARRGGSCEVTRQIHGPCFVFSLADAEKVEILTDHNHSSGGSRGGGHQSDPSHGDEDIGLD